MTTGITPEQIAEAQRLRALGHSLRSIAMAVGVSYASVGRLGLPRPDRIIGLDGKSHPAAKQEPVPTDDDATRIVYGLYDGDEPLYVGCAVDLRRRVMQHLRSKPWAAQVTHVAWRDAEGRDAGAAWETLLIHLLVPAHNTVWNEMGVARRRLARTIETNASLPRNDQRSLAIAVASVDLMNLDRVIGGSRLTAPQWPNRATPAAIIGTTVDEFLAEPERKAS